MLKICEKCGGYRADKTIDPSGPFAICPECGHRTIFGTARYGSFLEPAEEENQQFAAT